MYLFANPDFLLLFEILHNRDTCCYLERIIEFLNIFHLLLCKYLSSGKA